MRLGGLGFRLAKTNLPAAFISSCNSTRQFHFCYSNYVEKFGTTYFTTATTSDASLSGYIPGEDEAHSRFRNIFADFYKEDLTDLSSMSQKSLQSWIECSIFASLKESRSLRDNARLNTVPSIHAAAWLRGNPNPKLGLAWLRMNL